MNATKMHRFMAAPLSSFPSPAVTVRRTRDTAVVAIDPCGTGTNDVTNDRCAVRTAPHVGTICDRHSPSKWDEQREFVTGCVANAADHAETRLTIDALRDVRPKP
jgi:hypothetical protein